MILSLCCEIHNKSLTTIMTKLFFCIGIRAIGDDGKEHIIAIIRSPMGGPIEIW